MTVLKMGMHYTFMFALIKLLRFLKHVPIILIPACAILGCSPNQPLKEETQPDSVSVLEAKLDNIIIPKLELKNVTIEEAFTIILDLAKRNDRHGEGLKGISLFTINDMTKRKRFSIVLHNVSLRSIFNEIGREADLIWQTGPPITFKDPNIVYP